MLFEKQAKRENVNKNDWVTQLIPILPTDIAELIVKESEDKSYEYSHIKKLLMQRFKLSTLALRTAYEEYTCNNGNWWVDLVYELRVYLDSWLESFEVKYYDGLKKIYAY